MIARATSRNFFSFVKCITEAKKMIRQMLYKKETETEKMASVLSLDK